MSSFQTDVEIKYVVDQTLKTIASIWDDVYGANDFEKEFRLEKYKCQIVSLSNEMISSETTRKDALIARIEESLAKQSQLEKLLNLQKKDNYGIPLNTVFENLPLVEIDAILLNMIDEYKIIAESRLEHLATLQAKEVTLCTFLDKSTQYLELGNGLVPSEAELKAFDNRILKLEQEKADLIETFPVKKAELASLLNELGIPALTEVERSAISYDDDQFPITTVNLGKLKVACEQYRQTKVYYIAKADELRRHLRKIWPKIKREPGHLEKLLLEYSGYSKSDIDKLTQELEECNAIQKKVLKELIQSLRSELKEWWDKCGLSGHENNQYFVFETDICNEDVLTLHFLEMERLRSHYNNYKQLYDMFAERKTMWEHLQQFEDLAKDPQRLFSNRGGQLLVEEKKRKALQKDILKIEKKMKKKVKEYEEIEKKQFVYHGETLEELIHREWTEKEARKENEKQQQKNKTAYSQTTETESKLESKPTLSPSKRKLEGSQSQLASKMQKTNPSTPLGHSNQGHNRHQMGYPMTLIWPRTPNRAESTPDLSLNSATSSSTSQGHNRHQMGYPMTLIWPRTPNRAESTPDLSLNSATSSSTSQGHNRHQMGYPMVPRTPNRAESTPDLSLNSATSSSTSQKKLDF